MYNILYLYYIFKVPKVGQDRDAKVCTKHCIKLLIGNFILFFLDTPRDVVICENILAYEMIVRLCV